MLTFICIWIAAFELRLYFDKEYSDRLRRRVDEIYNHFDLHPFELTIKTEHGSFIQRGTHTELKKAVQSLIAGETSTGKVLEWTITPVQDSN